MIEILSAAYAAGAAREAAVMMRDRAAVLKRVRDERINVSSGLNAHAI